MAKKTAIQRISNYSTFDRALSSLLPSHKPSEIRVVRAKVLEYIAKGLKDGYNIALIKPTSDEEIKIKVLNLLEGKRDRSRAIRLLGPKHDDE